MHKGGSHSIIVTIKDHPWDIKSVQKTQLLHVINQHENCQTNVQILKTDLSGVHGSFKSSTKFIT